MNIKSIVVISLMGLTLVSPLAQAHTHMTHSQRHEIHMQHKQQREATRNYKYQQKLIKIESRIGVPDNAANRIQAAKMLQSRHRHNQQVAPLLTAIFDHNSGPVKGD